MIRSVTTPTVLLAGGGTGGHLFPGVATAEELGRRAPGSRVLLAPTQRDRLARHGLACRLETVAVESPRTPRSALGLPLFGGRLAAALARSHGILRDTQPHVVVGLGGYGSLAPVLAARALEIPVLLLEQNALPGKATKFLSRFGSVTAAAFPELGRKGVRGRVVETGNPVRRGVLASRPAHADFGLDPGLPVLAVIGGSLGARGLNRRVACGVEKLVDAAGGTAGGRARFQAIHAAGSAEECPDLEKAYAEAGVRACVRPFFDDMGAVYGTADVVLCRAGGTTVAELAALGRPAVFVPYPWHGDRHQEANAEPLVRGGAATIVPEERLTPVALAVEVGPLLRDAALRAARAAAARGLGRPDAAARVVDLVLTLAGRRVEEHR